MKLRNLLAAAAALSLVAGSALAQTVNAYVTFVPPGGTAEANGASQTVGSTSTQILAAIASKKHFLTELDCNNFSNTDTGVTVNDTSGGRHFFCQHLLSSTYYFNPPLTFATNTAVNFTMDNSLSTMVVNVNGYNK